MSFGEPLINLNVLRQLPSFLKDIESRACLCTELCPFRQSEGGFVVSDRLGRCVTKSVPSNVHRLRTYRAFRADMRPQPAPSGNEDSAVSPVASILQGHRDAHTGAYVD